MTPEKIRPTFTFTEDRLAELRAVVPEAFPDGELDWDTLREALGAFLPDGDGPAEHFGLTWPGKREARRLAAKPSHGALHPAPGEGVAEDTTRNLFLEGDNLEVLKLLQKSYAGRVKMIYIDPPYNTGNDFVYKDNFTEPLADYLRRSGQAGEKGELLTSNPKSSGRFHTNWLNMMYPRLRLARTLLRDDGVIFVSIDDNEVHNLREVMDEIFGEERFVADIAVVNNLKGRNDRQYIATAHEHLLFYARENFVSYGLQLTAKQLADYGEVNESGNAFQWRDLRKRGGADTRESRPKLFYPVYADPKTGKVSVAGPQEGLVPVFPTKSDGVDGCWRWSRDKVAANLDQIKAVQSSTKGKWNISYQVHLVQNGKTRVAKPKSVWIGSQFSTDVATKTLRNLMPDFGNIAPKPVGFLTTILQQSTDEEDIVLDFFSGSGTTAHAVLQINREDGGNRQFVAVQVPESTGNAEFPTIADVGKGRIRRVIAEMQEQPPLGMRDTPEDLGFKVYKLESSSFKAWKDYEGDDLTVLQSLFDDFESPLVPDWKPADLQAEVMLLEGFPLDSVVEPQSQFTRNAVTLVSSPAGGHRLWMCFDAQINRNTIESLVLPAGDVFVCLDAALDDDTKVRLTQAGSLKTI